MDCIVRLGNGRAIGRARVSVFVIRAFVKMREALRGTPELARKLAALEKKLTARLDMHEAAIVQVLREVMQILNPPSPPPVRQSDRSVSMFAKGMRADTEFGDESDTAQGITPTHHQFATSTARAATAQNWFSPALNHAEASAKAAAFYLSAFRTPHSTIRNFPQFFLHTS
jgi:hypothetical protein